MKTAPDETIVDAGGAVRLRRADARDVPILVELLGAKDVEPFLASRSASSRVELEAEIERWSGDPPHGGRLVREGVRRRAYWRRGNWVDGVLLGVVAESEEPAPPGAGLPL